MIALVYAIPRIRCLLAGLLEASWGVLEAFWAAWRPYWAASERSWAILVAWVGLLGRRRSHGQFPRYARAAQGPPGVGAAQSPICETAGGRPLNCI
eukprot:4050100-Pyramimonas_sp.AAC.1